MRELLEAFPQSALVELARTLVRVPSEQGPLFESDPAIQSFIGDCVMPMLAAFGHAGWRDAMGNAIFESGPAHGARPVMLMGYAMTHPANAMPSPFAAELLDTPGGPALRGRGIAEQKGSLAAAIAAFVAASRIDPGTRRMLVLSTAGETGSHVAAECILSAIDVVPALCVVAIGTGGRLSLANKGRLDVHVEVRGRSSHSSTPWAGVDAIAGARVVMDRLAALDLGPKRHPLLGAATLSATGIRSFPEATHTIQDQVRLTYDRRLLPGDDADEALRQVAAALQGIEPWQVEVRAGVLQYPAEMHADGAFMRAMRAGCARIGVAEPEVFASHGCVDAGLLQRRGCEAAMWGPGDQAMWHTADEQLPVQALVHGAAGYLGLLLAAGSGPA
ncbi:MAG: M20 family metallopeptidase [bacterium]|jgi:acetylornithine deacetylase/succinyl-diaminopimelate desuccinylase-like protein|nr:M20/M25/M40 family metallo-hydrolase [Betaproteobacteria bacterium]